MDRDKWLLPGLEGENEELCIFSWHFLLLLKRSDEQFKMFQAWSMTNVPEKMEPLSLAFLAKFHRILLSPSASSGPADSRGRTKQENAVGGVWKPCAEESNRSRIKVRH